MKIIRTISLIFLFLTSLSAQEYLDSLRLEEDFSFNRGDKGNYRVTSWNPTIGYSQIPILNFQDTHSPMDNFICDAMLERSAADFAFVNYGDISASLYQGDITELDVIALCPLNRTLVVLNVDGAFLMSLIEQCISGFRSGLAVGGGRIEFDSQRPSGHRLTYFEIGPYPVYPKKEFRVVTTDYLVDGNAGFDMLTKIESSNVFRTNIALCDAVKQYIEAHTPLGPDQVKSEQRCIKND